MLPEDAPALVRSELVQQMLNAAESMEKAQHGVLAEHLASWWRREAHLAEERHLSAFRAGLPDDTAAFLAFDDMGFQIARAACSDWARTN